MNTKKKTFDKVLDIFVLQKGVRDITQKQNVWQSWIEANNGSFQLRRTSDKTYTILKGEIPYRGFTLRYLESDHKPLKVECALGPGTPFSLNFWKEDLTERILQMFGQQDIQLGDEDFDLAYNIQSDNQNLARDFLRWGDLPRRIRDLDIPSFRISDEEGEKVFACVFGFTLDKQESYQHAHNLVCIVIDRLIEMSIVRESDVV